MPVGLEKLKDTYENGILKSVVKMEKKEDPFEGHKWNILRVLILLEKDFSRVYWFYD
ncbi:unnamed protein product [Sphenostylis stenocarpa]|uniref:Uncharacterized protein n=1 Tax=Sphenostylis stenocarpa TaxID=92480 RepID=A0AA86S9H0_9FABA|nr:unnamed protein product [Sphenostylis stenocarpa]